MITILDEGIYWENELVAKWVRKSASPQAVECAHTELQRAVECLDHMESDW